MNVGIIIHSKTGTTLKFGEIIAAELRQNGHTVEIVELATDIPVNGGSVRQSSKFKISNIPDCAKFDVILAGGPVWAFAASPVIIDCLKTLRNISGKKLLPIVTMGFPLPSMGGRQAIALMSNVAASNGADVLPGVVISMMFHNHQSDMEKAAFNIAGLLGTK